MAVQQREAEEVTLLMEQTWVKIQQRTFTRWCNTFLVERMMKIESFMDETFTDGKNLCNLLEIISGQTIKHNKKCRVKMQKLENVSFALQFLKKEGLVLVGIGPEDIVEPKLKLILGLIWTIILRYQIQRGEDQGGSAKSELLAWVNSMIGEGTRWNNPIKNFKGDWQDGVAICQLAEACEPGQMDLPRDFSGKSALEKATMGMDSAEENMGIPQVLYPEDMVEHSDELSNMTYISYFRDYLESQGQRKQQEAEERTPIAGNCYARGVGVEGPVEWGTPAPFEVVSVNKFGRQVPQGGHNFTASVKKPDGSEESVPLSDHGDGIYDGAWTPEQVGDHIVTVQLDGQHIKDSPFKVVSLEPELDASQCRMYGPGLEGGYVNHEGEFTIEAVAKNGQRVPMGGAPFLLIVDGPYGDADPKNVAITDNGDGSYRGTYTPVMHGKHVVRVELKGQDVAQSPVTVNIERDPNAADPNQSWAEGKGLEEPNTAEPATMKVHAVKADGSDKTEGGDLVDCEVLDPEGNVIPSKVVDNGDGTYDVEWQPEEGGPHTVDLFIRNDEDPTFLEHLKGYPKTVMVESGSDPSQTLVHGKGVEGGFLDTEPGTFTIEARNKKGEPMAEGGEPFVVEVKGPNGPVPCDLVDNNDGTYSGSYQPEIHGPHSVEITLKGDQVADSVYKVDVDAGADTSKTLVYGPGVEGNFLDTEPGTFTIEPRDKNGNPIKDTQERFDVTVQGPEGPVPCDITQNPDGTFSGVYQPTIHGPHTVDVDLKGEPVADSQYKLDVDAGADTSKTLVHGPGVEGNFKDTEPGIFTIEPRDKRGNPIKSGSGERFDVTVNGPEGPVPCELTENSDGTFTGQYQPTIHGPHTVDVDLKGEPVADSQYKLDVDAGADPSQTLVYGPGLEEGLNDQEPAEFYIEPRDKRGNPIKGCTEPIDVTIDGPNGPITPDVGEPDAMGKRTIKYQPEEGNNHIEVTHKDPATGEPKHVADSPYDVRVGAGADAGNSFLRSFTFVLETRSKKDEQLKSGGETDNVDVKISGPGNPTWQIEDLGTGEYRIDLDIDAKPKSEFEIAVKINGNDVKNSPFKQKF